VLGCAATTGSLETGKEADVVVVPLRRPVATLDAALAALIFDTDDLGVSRQWVALFAKRNGLNRSKAGRPSRYDNKKINELLGKGKTYAEIVDIVGAPSEDAVRAAQRYWKRKMN
jgi:hypothetical protein